ncbi:amino acid ABC transporter permease [Georgenia sp. 311]|uniref:amino acid ABC transporter permease n=1 Tax=Georgenia sp. 311 TaxID=2585134 RepID=UPI00111188E3|nr:amino acid ABC transporter permease [Georgenia sp. 311]TNC16701.1 amino acid ABC transporter permease [Georgenia sp. 311]
MSTTLFDAPGPRMRRRILVANIIGALVLLALLTWVVIGLAGKGQFTAQKWEPFLTSNVWENFFLPGLLATLKAAFLAIIGAHVFALVFGLGRLSQLAPVRWVSGAVVEFFRAVPVLIMMIFLYFWFTRSGVVPASEGPLWAVVVALTLYNGSVIAELLRSGVVSLPRGQREAALTIGLRHGQSLRLVELPQAMLAMLPSMVSQLVVILKDSALGYIITYTELLRAARLVGSNFGNLLPALLVAAVIFILINWLLTTLAERTASRMRARTAGPVRVGAPSAVPQSAGGSH